MHSNAFQPFDDFPDFSSRPLPQRAFGAFVRATHSHRQLMARKMSEHGIPPAQAFALREIAHNDGITQRDLAEMRHVARPTLTVMLQKMEKAGLIERRTDEHDQRYTRIYLTTQGEAMHKEMHGVLDEMIAQTVGRLSEADQTELVRLMGLLHDAVKTELGDEPVAT